MSALLEVTGLRGGYGRTEVLRDVDLALQPGEIVALLGSNGAGKSTLNNIVCGLVPAWSGRVRFDGHEVTRWPTHRIAARGIGWVPDDRRVFPTLTVARNLEIARKRTRFRAWTVAQCSEIFSALPYLMARECENLSGGYRPTSHRRLPVGLFGRELDLLEHDVDHGVQQLFLARHVVVKRHRARAERAGQPAHAQPVDPLAVGEPDRLDHHPLLAQRRV